MAGQENRTPSDFLFTYRGLLIDIAENEVEDRIESLRKNDSVDSRNSITADWYEQATGTTLTRTLGAAQNASLTLLVTSEIVACMIPVNPPEQGLPDTAPTPDDLKIIYRAMFVSNDSSENSEFAQFEIASQKGDFAAVEAQIARLYSWQTGETKLFRLSDDQKKALAELTSDDYLPASPFGFNKLGVY